MTILRLPQVIARTGLSKSSIYERMKAGDFPRRLLLGSRAVGWRASDIDEWLTSLCYVPHNGKDFGDDED